MNTNLRSRQFRFFGLRAFLAGSALAIGSTAFAQTTPAARLLAPIPVEAPAVSEARKSIVRAAPPDGAYSVPVNSRSQVYGNPRTAQQYPQTGTVESVPQQQSSFLQGLRESLFGKGTDSVDSVPQPATSQQRFTPIGMTFAGSQPAQAVAPAKMASPANPQVQPQPVPAVHREFAPVGMMYAGAQPAPIQVQPSVPPSMPTPGIYAGPPAYRWYGWGSVTPGANPYAPNGQYPRGSANWYAQTGATPGAFPVPVTLGAKPVGTDAPAYNPAVLPQPMMESLPQPRIQVEPVPLPSPLPIPTPPQVQQSPKSVDARPVDPRAIAQTPVAAVQPQPIFQPPSGPSIPKGQPTSVPVAPIAMKVPKAPSPEIQPAVAIVPQPADMPMETKPIKHLEPVKQPDLQPIAMTTGGHAMSKPAEPTWQTVPKPNSPSEGKPPAPIPEPPTSWSVPNENPAVRGQAMDENALVEQAIRGVCANRTSSLRFNHTGVGKVTVSFTTNDEAAAKAIAADIAKLQEVKAFEVSFEATVAGR